MDKEAFRGTIFHLFLKGMNATEIKAELDAVHGAHAPSYSKVTYWTREFQRGRTDVSDQPRAGRPRTATDDETVEKVREMVTNNSRVKVREIEDTLKISKERIGHILSEILGVSKICARWVPRLLTDELKSVRVRASQAGLELLRHNPKDFWHRFITVDETWVHHYTPETKEDSKQWTKRGQSAPVKAKTVPSAGKVMATVFWDAKGILLIDYLGKGKTINAEYYTALLTGLDAVLRTKRPYLNKKKVLFHQDNAPAHKAGITMAKLEELRYGLVEHPPYSPDLAPSDFFLFPQLKKNLSGQKFSSDAEVITAVNQYFESQESTFFFEGIKRLEHRWEKCIAVKGEYVEK